MSICCLIGGCFKKYIYFFFLFVNLKIMYLHALKMSLSYTPPRLMSGSSHPLKVSQELIKTYTQRRNSHLASTSGDEEPSEEPDPYAFVEGDEEFSFTEKKDKSGAEKDGNKKHKVGPDKG